jgi:hypothetical protein
MPISHGFGSNNEKVSILFVMTTGPKADSLNIGEKVAENSPFSKNPAFPTMAGKVPIHPR